MKKRDSDGFRPGDLIVTPRARVAIVIGHVAKFVFIDMIFDREFWYIDLGASNVVVLSRNDDHENRR